MLYENLFKKRRRDRVSANILSVNLLGEKKKDIIGIITITYCESHDCIILFFGFKGFHENHKRLFPKNFFVDKQKNGLLFSKQ